MLVQNIHLTTGVAQEHFHNVHPLVRHGLKKSVFAVPALEVDIDLGVSNELPDSGHVPIPDGVGEGSGAIVCGQVDVNIMPLEQNCNNVGSIQSHWIIFHIARKFCCAPFKAGSDERGVAIEAPHVHLDVWPAEQHLNYPGVILLNRDYQRSIS